MRYLLLILAAAVTLACPALAQKFIANPLSQLDTSPPLTLSELRIVDSIIGLTSEQRELTGALYDDFFDRFQTEAAEIEAQVITLIDESAYRSDGDAFARAAQLSENWNTRRDRFRDELVADLRLLLDQQQVELWPKVERELRRYELLPLGRLAAEQIDLIRLVDDYARGWDDDTELVALLDQYADRLDRALIARQSILDSDDAAEYPMLIKDDPLRAAELFEDVRERRVRVRDINISSLGAVLPRLTPEDASSLSAAFHRQATDALLPASMTEARIRAAANLPTLTNEQRSRIAGTLTDFEQRKREWTRVFFEVVAEAEEDALPSELAWAVARAEADTPADPKAAFDDEANALNEIMNERLGIDRDTWGRISAILTPQQRADVPRPVQETVRFGSLRPRGL